MEIIKTEQYIVDGYTFTDRKLAEKLDNLLKSTPNSKICPECRGTHSVTHHVVETAADEWGYPLGTRSVAKIKDCPKCKNGILTKVIKEEWI